MTCAEMKTRMVIVMPVVGGGNDGRKRSNRGGGGDVIKQEEFRIFIGYGFACNCTFGLIVFHLFSSYTVNSYLMYFDMDPL